MSNFGTEINKRKNKTAREVGLVAVLVILAVVAYNFPKAMIPIASVIIATGLLFGIRSRIKK
jgi:hypothetical protein